MRPRIAIPIPHSGDLAYAERALPQYERAVEMAGGEPVRIPVDRAPAEVMKLIERCDAVLLPGSKADVDPESMERRDTQRLPPPMPGATPLTNYCCKMPTTCASRCWGSATDCRS